MFTSGMGWGTTPKHRVQILFISETTQLPVSLKMGGAHDGTLLYRNTSVTNGDVINVMTACFIVGASAARYCDMRFMTIVGFRSSRVVVDDQTIAPLAELAMCAPSHIFLCI